MFVERWTDLSKQYIQRHILPCHPDKTKPYNHWPLLRIFLDLNSRMQYSDRTPYRMHITEIHQVCFPCFSNKPYLVGTLKNRLDEAILKRTHKIRFGGETWKTDLMVLCDMHLIWSPGTHKTQYSVVHFESLTRHKLSYTDQTLRALIFIRK